MAASKENGSPEKKVNLFIKAGTVQVVQLANRNVSRLLSLLAVPARQELEKDGIPSLKRLGKFCERYILCIFA